MYKKVKTSVFFKLFIKFVTFETCVFLPAVRINLLVKKRTQLRLTPLKTEKICVLYYH